MADVRKAFVRDGVVHAVYFDDEATLSTKLAPIAAHLIECDETVQPNWLYRDGSFIDPVTLLPAPTVRQKRKVAYFEELRVEEGDDPLTVLGDQFDKVLAQVEAIRAAVSVPRTTDFNALITTVLAIKARLPKP